MSEPLCAAATAFEMLLEASPGAMVVSTPEGRITSANARFETLFQYTHAELCALRVDDLLPPASEAVGRRKDGSEFPAEVVRTAGDGLSLCLVRDLTAEREAEAACRAAQRRLEHVLETMNGAFFALDREWRFLYVNARAGDIIGRAPEQLLGRILWDELPDVADSVFCQEYRRAVQEERPAVFTAFEPRRKIWLEVAVHTSEAGLDVHFDDVTARKALEEHSSQTQRLESLGRLTGGVAHDFNNLLTVIGGYGQMLLDAVGARSPLRKDLEPIVEAATRASGLTRQLLTFSRRQLVPPKIVDINRLITKLNKMLRRVIGEDIELKLALRSGIGRILADPGQIEQVIMNLAVNARDAMPSGGALSIVTDNVEVGEEAAGAVPAGSYVLLSLADTGSGIDPETREHVFEPFFTTKAKGTGIGLSTVYSIVKQSGGEIEVDSEPGHGTCFRVYLPRTRKETHERRAGVARRPRKGSETILLVEDEPDVRRLAREMLERLGYHILDAADAAEAIALWNTRPSPIDMLVTDVIMPQVSGRELARTLTASHPGLKVLYITGYTDDVIARYGIASNDAAVLQKPFSRETLGLKVRSILDAGQPASTT